MNEQEIVDHVATIAMPRFSELLRLKVSHVYDDTPGDAGSVFHWSAAVAVKLKLTTAVQRYASIERFVTEEKQMGFLVNPGLLPLVKAIALDVRGRRLLVTRRIAARETDKGVAAHLHGFGVRLLIHTDTDAGETLLTWECLYGVA